MLFMRKDDRIKNGSEMWNNIIKSFSENPRDISTSPINKKAPVWFYAFSTDGKLFVTGSESHAESAKISSTRTLQECKCQPMHDFYIRRSRGEAVSALAGKVSVNQSYWYGIFAEIENHM